MTTVRVNSHKEWNLVMEYNIEHHAPTDDYFIWLFYSTWYFAINVLFCNVVFIYQFLSTDMILITNFN